MRRPYVCGIGRTLIFSGSCRLQKGFYKKVLIALISFLTLYRPIGNVS